MEENKYFHSHLQWAGNLYTKPGYYTKEEFKEEMRKTDDYFKSVMLKYKNLSWYKKIFTPYPFTTFSNMNNQIYENNLV